MLLKKIIISVFSILFLSSCGLVKKIAGADLDPIHFEKARNAKMLETRLKYSDNLLSRLNQKDQIDNGDIQFVLSQDLLNKILKQYENCTGWLDDATSYKIVSTNLQLKSGVAIVSLGLLATNKKYSADVKLNLDCIMAFNQVNNEIIAELEPFNISPKVEINSILSSADEIVENLIKINLANLSKTLPPLKIPVDFSNQFVIPGSITKVSEKVNLSVTIAQRQVNYKLKLKELLIFESGVLVSLNLESIEVK